MTIPVHQSLGHAITCIDAAYLRPGIACFYLLESRGEYAVIETGTNHSIDNLQQCLDDAGVDAEQVRYIIPTHVHLDHAGGAGAMMQRCPQAELLVHPRGARHMVAPEKLISASMAVYGETVFRQLYGEVEAIDERRIRAMDDGDSVCVGDRRLQFRHAEGHARHHFCVWDERSRGWFTGDMFGVCYPWYRFSDGDFVLPATTPTQFDPPAYQASLDMLHGYAPERMYLTHYGMIQYSQRKKALLAEQVAAYAALAADSTVADDDVEATLIDYSLGQLRRAAPDVDDAQLRQWLSLDMPLNVQGLLHWRHARND